MSKHIFDLKECWYVDDVISFGKYQGLTWLDVLSTDPNYIVWCVGNTSHKYDPSLVVRAIQQDYAQRKTKKFSQEDYTSIYYKDPFLNTHERKTEGGTGYWVPKKFYQLDAGKPNNVGWDDWDDDIPF